MKKILYISNIEVPYRVRFFNELSKSCDLTVLYERRKSSNRDDKWAFSENSTYKVEYLDGIKIGNELSFSFKIFNIIKKKWDLVIIGCYNSKIQMIAIIAMRLMNIPYSINLDGEPFIDKSFKGYIKKFFLTGAKGYLVAGEKSSKSLRTALGINNYIEPYYFSSLNKEEILNNGSTEYCRDKTVLVIGQYFEYKGMDIALEVARRDLSIKYKFVGMGKRTQLFCADMKTIPENVEIIPFLQKEELEDQYKKCGLLLLPTRQECWGLVINEAASFGMPIVSTWGSGAAVEFLDDNYPQYLAKSGDVDELYHCIKNILNNDNKEYSHYLKQKSICYNIERNVSVHQKMINTICL